MIYCWELSQLTCVNEVTCLRIRDVFPCHSCTSESLPGDFPLSPDFLSSCCGEGVGIEGGSPIYSRHSLTGCPIFTVANKLIWLLLDIVIEISFTFGPQMPHWNESKSFIWEQVLKSCEWKLVLFLMFFRQAFMIADTEIMLKPGLPLQWWWKLIKTKH